MMATGEAVVRKRRDTRALSESVAAAAEKRSLTKPVIVTGIGPGMLINVTQKEFTRLDVDPGYQRGETSMVHAIVRALQAGGSILDPVTLCQRRGQDSKWWIVDGYQRVCAYQQLGVTFSAMLHKSDSADAEHLFFIALNARRALNPNVIVKAWTGPSGALLLNANQSLEHPLHNRINFEQSSNKSRLGAASLVKALNAVIAADRSGTTDQQLSRLDLEMGRSQFAKKLFDAYLRMVGTICPHGALPLLVMRALAQVSHERWKHSVEMPSSRVIERLHATKWDASFILVEKYYPILVDGVRKKWPA